MTAMTIDTSSTPSDDLEFYPRRTAMPVLPDLPPPSLSELRQLQAHQAAFDKAFPPLRTRDSDVLILSWDEIERQFVDLAAPWDQENAAYQIRQARQMSAWETPEKTMRWLFVLSHASPGVDAAEPPHGTGDRLPMP